MTDRMVTERPKHLHKLYFYNMNMSALLCTFYLNSGTEKSQLQENVSHRSFQLCIIQKEMQSRNVSYEEQIQIMWMDNCDVIATLTTDPYRLPRLHKVSFASQRLSGHFLFFQFQWNVSLVYSCTGILKIFCVWSLIQEPPRHIAPGSVHFEPASDSPIHLLRLPHRTALAILCRNLPGLPSPLQPSFSTVLYQSVKDVRIYCVLTIISWKELGVKFSLLQHMKLTFLVWKRGDVIFAYKLKTENFLIYQKCEKASINIMLQNTVTLDFSLT